jgi:hypothetical protein
MVMPAQHSKLFSTPVITDFFTKLKAIAPEYLDWHEAEGKLICIQKPVDPKADNNIINTVEKVMKKLHLTLKPGEHAIDKQTDGKISYTFSLKGIYDQLNTDPWIRKHASEFANINSKQQTRKPKR